MNGDSTGGEDNSGGITRCICARNDDVERFMIQCDGCHVWQHGACVGILQTEVPDEYWCELCKPDDPVHVRRQKGKKKSKGKVKKGPRRRRRKDVPEVELPPRKRVTRSSRSGIASQPSLPKTRREVSKETKLTRDEKKLKMLMETFQRIEERQRKRALQDASARQPKARPVPAAVVSVSSAKGAKVSSVSSRKESTRDTAKGKPVARVRATPRSVRNTRRSLRKGKSRKKPSLSPQGHTRLHRRMAAPLTPLYFGKKQWLMAKVREERVERDKLQGGSRGLRAHMKHCKVPMARRVLAAYRTEHPAKETVENTRVTGLGPRQPPQTSTANGSAPWSPPTSRKRARHGTVAATTAAVVALPEAPAVTVASTETAVRSPPTEKPAVAATASGEGDKASAYALWASVFGGQTLPADCPDTKQAFPSQFLPAHLSPQLQRQFQVQFESQLQTQLQAQAFGPKYQEFLARQLHAQALAQHQQFFLLQQQQQRQREEQDKAQANEQEDGQDSSVQQQQQQQQLLGLQTLQDFQLRQMAQGPSLAIAALVSAQQREAAGIDKKPASVPDDTVTQASADLRQVPAQAEADALQQLQQLQQLQLQQLQLQQLQLQQSQQQEQAEQEPSRQAVPDPPLTDQAHVPQHQLTPLPQQQHQPPLQSPPSSHSPHMYHSQLHPQQHPELQHDAQATHLHPPRHHTMHMPPPPPLYQQHHLPQHHTHAHPVLEVLPSRQLYSHQQPAQHAPHHPQGSHHSHSQLGAQTPHRHHQVQHQHQPPQQHHPRSTFQQHPPPKLFPPDQQHLGTQLGPFQQPDPMPNTQHITHNAVPHTLPHTPHTAHAMSGVVGLHEHVQPAILPSTAQPLAPAEFQAQLQAQHQQHQQMMQLQQQHFLQRQEAAAKARQAQASSHTQPATSFGHLPPLPAVVDHSAQPLGLAADAAARAAAQAAQTSTFSLAPLSTNPPPPSFYPNAQVAPALVSKPTGLAALAALATNTAFPPTPPHPSQPTSSPTPVAGRSKRGKQKKKHKARAKARTDGS